MNMKSIALLGLLLPLVSGGVARASDERAPDVPAALVVGDDYKVSFHAYAVGVQIYTATVSPMDPSKLVWTFIGPEAVLFDADGEIVGTHYPYAGPTRPAWETASGSIVVGARSAPPEVVDPTAIPWLLLDAVKTEGPGVLARTEKIQRVHTTGGLAPFAAPTQLGQVARMPYTAEYFFYRAAE